MIRLTEDEAAAALTVAQRRNSMNNGGTNLPGGETETVEERLARHYAACMAEISVCRHFNLCWSGCGKGAYGLPDVGDRLEVRSIQKRGKRLMIRPKDKKDRIFILVFVDVEKRDCELLGWATASEVRRRGQPYQDMHLLQEEELNSMEMLPWRRAQ